MRAFLVELFEADAPLSTLMASGLSGLTDDEYVWEPVAGCWSIRRRADLIHPDDPTWGEDAWGVDIEYPDPQPSPFTTIAWRMAHMTGSVLVAAAALRGVRRADGHLDETWDELRAVPITAIDAVDRWNRALALLRELLDAATEDDLERTESHAWLPGAAAEPVWKQVEYFGCFEPASHGAEVRLLRDLYRHTRGGAIPLQASNR